jgi:hypothetical protein
MNQLDSNIIAHIEVVDFVQTLGLGLLYALILAIVVKRFSNVLGNRHRFLFIFPVLVPTTVLIISVIKSSLALSLGLVGALSIVRFRTPIKESEELAYLFLAIAIGVGLGAGQVMATSLCFVLVLFLLIALHLYARRVQPTGIYLDIESIPGAEDTGLRDWSRVMQERSIPYQLQRYEAEHDAVAATFYIEPSDVDDLEGLVSVLRPSNDNSRITVLNRTQPWG